jgi:hypothetical protein
MQTAPIILFTYNRLKHTRATVKALLDNKLASDSKLIIFSDAPSNELQDEKVREVRKFLKTIDGFEKIEIIERDKNYGLGENIIDGVTKVINQFGKAIILEDDLITSPYFLEFMNDALKTYESNPKVVSINGYFFPTRKLLPDTFFLKGTDCLGWGTWKRGWDNFERDGNILLKNILKNNQVSEFDFGNTYPYTQMLRDQVQGKNNSWAIRWYASAFVNDLYSLYPGRSLIFHSGGDGSGTNTGYDSLLDVSLSGTPIRINSGPVYQNDLAYWVCKDFYQKLNNPSLNYRIKRLLKKINLFNIR